jgi:hypothetical protein
MIRHPRERKFQTWAPDNDIVTLTTGLYISVNYKFICVNFFFYFKMNVWFYSVLINGTKYDHLGPIKQSGPFSTSLFWTSTNILLSDGDNEV